MRWLGGIEEAAGVSDGKLPILLYLRRAGQAAEEHDERTLFSNASVKQGSHSKFAAFRLDALMEDGAQAAKKYRVKRDGALVWMDGHLNRIRVRDGAPRHGTSSTRFATGPISSRSSNASWIRP